MKDQRLIIFTRYPEPGRVKTRLISALGEEKAASLHKRMVEHTLKWAAFFSKKDPDFLEIRFEGATKHQMREWLGPQFIYVHQGQGDLGSRMSAAFQENFQRKIERVVLVGTDCPQLSAFHAKIAFKALKNHDLVLVPTDDGGYSLIGLRRMEPALFESMAWGTDRVYEDTLERARKKGLSVKTLEALQDVDLADDLPHWEKISNQFLSIIIPTLNEEANLRRTLAQAGQVVHGEIIVVDGGSKDQTAQIAEEEEVRVLFSKPSRGEQMNVGASKASGSILLFLHADTLLPHNFDFLIRQALSDPEVAGGSFAWKVQPALLTLKFVEKTVNWRTKYFHLPFGDQGLFVRSSLFREMAGYANIPLMEDVEFVRRLKKRGKLAFIPEPVITSARGFKKLGVIRATLKNKLIFFGYFLKIPPERLARIYYKKR